MARAPLGFDFDPEEVTETDHPALNGDPYLNQGKLMAAVARLQKQVDEGFGAVRDLNGRLRRIERLLYGAVGSAGLGLLQFLIQRFSGHGP